MIVELHVLRGTRCTIFGTAVCRCHGYLLFGGLWLRISSDYDANSGKLHAAWVIQERSL
ncbi:hypothetical protein GCM10010471_25970 [Leucobacter komagatae]